MKQYKVGFLINPISGGGQGKVIARFLHEIMRSFAYDENEWVFEFTKIDGMQDQIEAMISHCTKIIAVGGDGTMSVVMQALLKAQSSNVYAGLIPLGTGNDLARILGIYRNYTNRGLLNTIRKLLSSEAHVFDLWMVNNAFTLAAYYSIGVDAKTAHNFDVLRKKGNVIWSTPLTNKLYYFFFGIKNRGYKIPSDTTLTFKSIQGEYQEMDVSGYTSLIIGNIGSYSGGAKPFIDSDFADGYLEIIPVKSMFHLLLVLASGRVPLIKQIFNKKLIKCYHASSVRVKQTKRNFTQIDGEAVTTAMRHMKNVDITHAGRVNLLSIESL
ncbi:MAG: diacylglycerol kinase family protein [Fibrobacterales bacterium]